MNGNFVFALQDNLASIGGADSPHQYKTLGNISPSVNLGDPLRMA